MPTKEHIPEIYAANSNVGCVREHNEDSFIAHSPLFVVADGMGGHEAGEVASEIAVNAISKHAPKEPDANQLSFAVQEANLEILNASAKGIGKPGMGTTVTAAVVFEQQLLIAQVGDSRAYLLHNGRLQRLTRDHSLVADLVAQGSITEEEARVHPQRSVITRALGSEPNVEPDIYILQLEKDDRILLCSDGLSSMIYDTKIEAILKDYKDVNTCCDELINAALKAGGLDNITAIVIDPLKSEDASGLRQSFKGAKAGAKAGGSRGKRAGKNAGKRRIFPVIWALVFVAVLAGSAFGFYAYAQNSYYVIAQDGNVAIYRGLPGSVAGLHLSLLEENTDIAVDKLAPTTAERLSEGISVDSLEDAHALIDGYRTDIASGSATAAAAGKNASGASSASNTSSASNAANKQNQKSKSQVQKSQKSKNKQKAQSKNAKNKSAQNKKQSKSKNSSKKSKSKKAKES